MTNETTPDAVEQAIASLVNVLVNECSHTSETASALDVCLANLRHARHAERARHAEEVAALRDQLRKVTAEREEMRAWGEAKLAGAQHEIAHLRDQLRKAEGERAMWEKTASVLSGKLDSLRSLLPDVRACAEHCISCSRSGEATTEAARRILAALDSQGGEGE